MRFLNIEKDDMDNNVGEGLYEAVYKSAGREIVVENPAVTETTKDPADEIIKKNTNKMKNPRQKNLTTD